MGKGIGPAALVSLFAVLALASGSEALYAATVIIDHNDTDITAIPEAAINTAKSALHIAYGHTSHGSQVIDGMTGLVGFANGGGKGLSLPTDIFAWNNGGTGGALDLHDKPWGYEDLGSPNRTQWEADTRTYLSANPDVNVIMWSWCGQVSTATSTDINTYLSLMNGLETNYPDVHFVYMTGHLDGTGLTGNLHLRNEQIRAYCVANEKNLYDFADIESYNPDGTYFGDKLPDDHCDYDADGAFPRTETGNWATEWQNTHTLNVDWYNCNCAHSIALNGNQKAYAAWALWTGLALEPGDANGDGLIDGVDLAIWQENYDPLGFNAPNNTFAMADWDGDGDIDGADLALWQENYAPLGYLGGSASGSLILPSAGAEIPEPATVCLVALGLGGLALIRRRRKK